MRMKKLAAVLGATTVLVGLLAGPAAAGTGASQACTDGVGWLWHGVNDPVTVGVELQNDPTTLGYQAVWVCYSTTTWGSPNDGIVGGAIRLDVAPVGTANPGAGVAINCLGDDSPSVGPLNCYAGTAASVAPPGVQAYPAGGVCVVAVNGACQFFLPGVVAYTSGAPVVSIVVDSALTGWLPFAVGLPAQCVGVLGGC